MSTAAETRASQDYALVKARIREEAAKDPLKREIILRQVICEDATSRLRREGYAVSNYNDGAAVRWE